MPSFGAIGGAKGIGVQGAGSAAAQTKKRTAEHSHAGAAPVRSWVLPHACHLFCQLQPPLMFCALMTHAQQLSKYAELTHRTYLSCACTGEALQQPHSSSF